MFEGSRRQRRTATSSTPSFPLVGATPKPRWMSLALCAALVSACTTGRGETRSKAPVGEGDERVGTQLESDVSGWYRVASDDAFASILFPEGWDLLPDAGVDEESELAYAEWQAEDVDTIYYLGIEAMGGVVEPGSGQEDELFLTFVQENLETLGGELLGQRRVYLDGFTGIGYDLRVQGENGESFTLLGRMFLVGDQRVLAFVYTPDAIYDEAELFLDSLRLESGAEAQVLAAHGPGWGELAMGNAAWLDGDQTAALDWYEKVIASGVFTPEFAANIEDRRARILFATGKWDEAAAALEAARAGGYETHMSARIRAAMYVRAKDYDAAVEEYDRIINDGGGDIEVAAARVQAQAGRLGKARRRLTEGVGSRGDVDVLLNTLVVDVDEALALDPGDPTLRLWRALLREVMGDRQGALLDMRRASAASPSSFGPRLVWAWDLMGTPGPERAKPFAEWLEKRSPRDAVLRRVLAELWMSAKAYDKAVPIFESLVSNDDASIELISRTGQTYVRLKREADARKVFERAFALDDASVEVRNSLAWLLATAHDAKVRDGARAVELARTFVYDGDDIRTHADMSSGRVDTLAAAYAEASMWAEAVQTQELALALAREEGREAEDLADFETRLAKYKAKEPWREDYDALDAVP